jgi:hypothetical protein
LCVVDLIVVEKANFDARQIAKAGNREESGNGPGKRIGRSKRVSVTLIAFGIGDETAAQEYIDASDYRPAAILERLDLRPI